MAQVLPVFPDQPEGRFTFTFGDSRYVVELTWRDRVNAGRGAWYLSLFTQAGAALIEGRRLSPRYAPTIDLVVDGAPAGYLYVTGPEPYNREQLGTDVQLRYYVEADIPTPPASTLRVEV